MKLRLVAKSIAIASLLAAACQGALAGPPAISITVGPDEALAYPADMPSLPDEHMTIFPPAPGSPVFRLYAATRLTGGNSGTVALESTDLKTFVPAAGYPAQVMTSRLPLRSCDPMDNTGFDQNYAAAGSVVQDPNLPPGNLIMVYEAENHCPGGKPQYPYYATVGFMRSADNGKTWPAPATGALGNASRYPVLKHADPQPAEPNDTAMGNAIPSGFVDGNYLYVVYVAQPAPPAVWDGKLRVARAWLNANVPATFTKWNNGAFSTPGIGGADSAITPAGGCIGNQDMGGIYRYDPLGVYLLFFVCRNQGTHEASWYFSVATSLDLQDWSVPQLVQGSQSTLTVPCGANGDGQQFDGWFPSFVSPTAVSNHLTQAGYAFYGKGCNTDNRSFARRVFAVTVEPGGPNVDQQGLTGSWFNPATSGQGVELEVYPDHVAPGTGYLQGSWFTFINPPTGGQGALLSPPASNPGNSESWYTFGGNVLAGASSSVFTIYANTGGRFNAPPATAATPVGFATLAFADCMNAQLDFVFVDPALAGSIPLTRLTQNVGCNTVTSGDFGLSGNWFDPATSGQGFVIELNPNSKAMFLTWYTYPAPAMFNSGQRWYTGLASYTPGARSIPFTLRETTGGGFNVASPPPTTSTVGAGTLTFTSCGAATLQFTFDAGSNAGQAGSIALSRVGPTPASCVF